MTDDADRQAVLDVIASTISDWLFQELPRPPGMEHDLAAAIVVELIAMPDKGPLLRALGITPGDLGLEYLDFEDAWAFPDNGVEP